MFTFSSRSKSRMVGLHGDMILLANEVIKASPIDFGIAGDGGVRTAARQKEMYDDPDIKTYCDGYVRFSRHQIQPGEKFGTALDFFPYLQGKVSYDPVHVAIVGTVFMVIARQLYLTERIKLNIRWGASFGSRIYKGWDGVHIEGRKPKNIKLF